MGDLWSIFLNLGRNENPISQRLCDLCCLLTLIFLVSSLYRSWSSRPHGFKVEYVRLRSGRASDEVARGTTTVLNKQDEGPFSKSNPDGARGIFDGRETIKLPCRLTSRMMLSMLHVALVKLGSKRVYASVSVKHNCTRFYGISRCSLPWLKMNEQTVFWVAIDGDLPCVQWTVNLPWYVVMCTLILFFDRYHLRETRFPIQGSKWSGRQALSNKRAKTKKEQKEKERRP